MNAAIPAAAKQQFRGHSTSDGDGTDPPLSLSRDLCYSSNRAVEVVEGATHAIRFMGASTMLALGIVLNIIGLGFFCWVLFTLAIYALPFLVGVTAGLYAHQSGIGPFSSIVLGLVAAAFVLVIGQAMFVVIRTPILRVAVALLFTVPAALAGYYATFGLSGLTVTSDLWRQIFAAIGAVVIGAAAWTRLAASPPSESGRSGKPALP